MKNDFLRLNLSQLLILSGLCILMLGCENEFQPSAPTNLPNLSTNKMGGSSALFEPIPQPIANLPNYKIGAVAFTIYEKFAFVGTGFNWNPVTGLHTPSKDFWKYNPANNTWTQVADFGGVARTFATAFSINSKGYVGTGAASSNLNDLWEYDYNTNTWTQRANLPGEARHGATGFSIGTKGYIATGLNQENLKDLWEYNPATNSWLKKADLGGSPRRLAGSFTINGAGYVGAGNANTPLFDFWKYNPTTNTWSQSASLGNDSMPEHSGFFSIGKNGYAGGNQQLWKFDSGLNTWTKIASFPDTMQNGVGFSLLGMYGYIGSGNYLNNAFGGYSFYRYSL